MKTEGYPMPDQLLRRMERALYDLPLGRCMSAVRIKGGGDMTRGAREWLYGLDPKGQPCGTVGELYTRVMVGSLIESAGEGCPVKMVTGPFVIDYQGNKWRVDDFDIPMRDGGPVFLIRTKVK